MSAAPEAYKWLISLNPMATVIEGIRLGLLGKGSCSLADVTYLLTVTGSLLIIGTLVFNKVEKNFVDTV
jgi:lipopolysaccharide transport system permease protein